MAITALILRLYCYVIGNLQPSQLVKIQVPCKFPLKILTLKCLLEILHNFVYILCMYSDIHKKVRYIKMFKNITSNSLFIAIFMAVLGFIAISAILVRKEKYYLYFKGNPKLFILQGQGEKFSA